MCTTLTGKNWITGKKGKKGLIKSFTFQIKMFLNAKKFFLCQASFSKAAGCQKQKFIWK